MIFNCHNCKWNLVKDVLFYLFTCGLKHGVCLHEWRLCLFQMHPLFMKLISYVVPIFLVFFLVQRWCECMWNVYIGHETCWSWSCWYHRRSDQKTDYLMGQTIRLEPPGREGNICAKQKHLARELYSIFNGDKAGSDLQVFCHRRKDVTQELASDFSVPSDALCINHHSSGCASTCRLSTASH